MNTSKVFSMALGIALLASVSATASHKDCHFTDSAKLKTHLADHVKYPITGKALKEVCKKEWPDEFSKAEQSCFKHHIKDKTEYKTSEDVMKDLGVNS